MNKYELAKKINDLDGLTNEEKSELLKLLRSQKKYGLVWEDKPEDAELRMVDEMPVLEEVPERAIISDDAEAPNHVLIEGDNLEALTALSYTHTGKIDVIYIDPPYNTGNKDFVYNDSFVDRENGYRHSMWLSFMNKRLRLAKKLLSRDGVIFISIDDNEIAALTLLCDDIFGEANHLTTFHIQVRYAEKSLNEEKAFKPLMEYVLFYAKDASAFEPQREMVEYGLDKFCFKITEVGEGTCFSVNNQEVQVFKKGEWKIEKVEGNLSGLKETWITGSIYTTMSYGKVFKQVVEPRVKIDGLGCLYKVMGRGEDGLGYRYYTGPAKATATKGKMYSGVPLENVALFKSGNAPKRALPILTVFDFAPEFGNIRHEGGVPFGSGKKPVKMLRQFLNYHKNKNAIVLDFFAGSASTGHAVMAQNAEDGGKRVCILATNNEANICEEKAYPRLCNVINGYGKEKGLTHNNLRYYKTKFVPRDKTTKNLRDLMALSTDMLCIRNDAYTEKPFAGKNINKNIARYFESCNGLKRMLVIYREEAIAAIVQLIYRVCKDDAEKIHGVGESKNEDYSNDAKKKLLVYVFSPNGYAYDDEFEDVADQVELCALPDAILNAYRRVLPKRKSQLLSDALSEFAQEEENGNMLTEGVKESSVQEAAFFAEGSIAMAAEKDSHVRKTNAISDKVESTIYNKVENNDDNEEGDEA